MHGAKQHLAQSYCQGTFHPFAKCANVFFSCRYPDNTCATYDMWHTAQSASSASNLTIMSTSHQSSSSVTENFLDVPHFTFGMLVAAPFWLCALALHCYQPKDLQPRRQGAGAGLQDYGPSKAGINLLDKRMGDYSSIG
jgi:hypothetical protein